MRILCLQHVPFEGPAALALWAESRGHDLAVHPLYENPDLPDPDGFDLLWVLGGPMNVDEEERFPWLAGEKAFIGRCLKKNKPMLGICLGAQLMAGMLGAAVVPGLHREVGFHEVQRTDAARASPLFREFPDAFTAFHWHGDTFAVPQGAHRIFHSRACANQGFLYRRAVGVQFHLETTEQSMEALIDNCAEVVVAGGTYVQDSERMREQVGAMPEMNRLCFLFMDAMEKLLAQGDPDTFGEPTTSRPPSC